MDLLVKKGVPVQVGAQTAAADASKPAPDGNKKP
jgi:hypothetical protein